MEHLIDEAMLNGKKYYMYLIEPNTDDFSNGGFKFPYIIAFPENVNEGATIAVESNNIENPDLKEVINSSRITCEKLTSILRDSSAPVFVPVIPNKTSEDPYFQQLAPDCFDKNKVDEQNQRTDLQVINAIKDAKKRIEEKAGIELNDKIFLNGYSSSGVFAQRFALLHPEIIDTVCIGGASASIPMPNIVDAKYPIGVSDFEVISDKPFDFDLYSNIKFRYYLGEREEERKSDSRTDDRGNLAPMHDMTYKKESMSPEEGKKHRKHGFHILERAERCTEILQTAGLDIIHQTIEGRGHNDYRDIAGVNEKADSIIDNAYKETLNKNLNHKI